VGKLRKALTAAVMAGAAALAAGLPDGLTGGEITTVVAGFLIAGLTTWGVPNSGFLDLSGLSAQERAQLDSFLNLR
jgi:hypothetical protein